MTDTAERPAAPGPVLVMGAGSVGCYVGGLLQAAGVPVQFVGRPRVLHALRQHGLTLTDRDGTNVALPPERLQLLEQPAPGAALALLCVKTVGTREAAAQLAAVLPPGTPVLSLQNGVDTVDTAAAAAPSLDWIRGMVPYNIAELGPGRYHRGTSGRLAAQDNPSLRAWLPVLQAAGLPMKLHADLRPVQWAKLLLNLNNPVNALSGLPLRDELLDRDCRVVLATLQTEALEAMAAAGIVPAQLTALPPHRVPRVLRLPTFVFRIVAKKMLAIDAHARSSMADDLARGRPTEVDAFCGAVVRLAQSRGRQAPVNARMAALLAMPRPPTMPGRAMRRMLGV